MFKSFLAIKRGYNYWCMRNLLLLQTVNIFFIPKTLKLVLTGRIFRWWGITSGLKIRLFLENRNFYTLSNKLKYGYILKKKTVIIIIYVHWIRR